MSENIIMVTVDSFRADHCGFMGYEKDTTPTIDKMAEEGTAFENAVSPGPRTPESMPVIFTGEFLPDDLPTDMVPQQSMIRQHMQTRRSLPERLSERGYETIGFTPNPFTSRYFNFDEGFDRYEDFIGDEDSSLYESLFEGWLGGNTISNVLRLGRNMVMKEEVFKPWEAFYDDVLDAIEDASEPYLIWIFLMDVHEPYLAGDGYHSISAWKRWKATWEMYLGDKETPFDDKTVDRLITSYDDSIRYTDAFFERLLGDVGTGDDDPLVVMHGDHGEAFGEHGVFSHEPYLHEENVHVPLVFSKDIGVTGDTPISLRDLPDLLVDVVDDEGDTDLSEGPYAISRTSKDDKIAIRGRIWRYIQSATAGRLFDVQENESELQNEQLSDLGDDIAGQQREHVNERNRIEDAIKNELGIGDL